MTLGACTFISRRIPVVRMRQMSPPYPPVDSFLLYSRLLCYAGGKEDWYIFGDVETKVGKINVNLNNVVCSRFRLLDETRGSGRLCPLTYPI
jgi:hypothetical protein